MATPEVPTEPSICDDAGNVEILSTPRSCVWEVMEEMGPASHRGWEEVDSPHIVLLGDSTLDNGRYLDVAHGELSVGRQLWKRCADRGWDCTTLARDGSVLEDVLLKQLPLIPKSATHIVLSASGNDLLHLLNGMVMARFTVRSMYEAMCLGLAQTAERYRKVLEALKGLGRHVACCTVYRPNFNHVLFKSLAMVALGMHNARLRQICVELETSVIDLASIFDQGSDFASPLELGARGGAKVVENITAFVAEHPVLAMPRFLSLRSFMLAPEADDSLLFSSAGVFGGAMRCCATRAPTHKVYASTKVVRSLIQPNCPLPGQRPVLREQPRPRPAAAPAPPLAPAQPQSPRFGGS